MKKWVVVVSSFISQQEKHDKNSRNPECPIKTVLHLLRIIHSRKRYQLLSLMKSCVIWVKNFNMNNNIKVENTVFLLPYLVWLNNEYSCENHVTLQEVKAIAVFSTVQQLKATIFCLPYLVRINNDVSYVLKCVHHGIMG